MPALLIPYAARLTGVLDGFDKARTAANSTLSFPTVTPFLMSIARSGLGLIAVLRGEREDAGEQYNVIKQWRGTILNAMLATDRLLGLLAQTMDILDRATTHFEDSLSFCRKAGYRTELAWTCCDYADTLLQRNNPGDREKAMSLLDESLSISSELGMRPLMERVLSRRDILKA